ncbi:MAG TPA: DUF6600 domain-containing protein [Stellaceae bacterium]|nr:DUF6600 domain-containing protein [Stellaceae bacterium]
MRRLILSVIALCTVAALPALAQEEPPARVGRVSFVEGQLAFHTKGETTWSSAAVNYPVATGGSFWTDPKSRAEIRIGAQTINLSGNAEVDIVKLNEQVMQLAVPQGRVEVQLRQLGEGESAELDMPRGGVWLLQPGIYDIDAGTPTQATRVAVVDGRARFVGGIVDIGVNAGQAASISGTQTLTASLEKFVPDAFAQWCHSRAYHEHRLAAPYYVSPRMTGYEELDEYGAWRTAPEYGRVWYPRGLPAGWSPYTNGYWIWEAPWGWNWIDLEPWGFAPFHYGRWAQIGGAWGWVPGAFVGAPVYAPALVAFIADPAAILASAFAGPLVGWFPLGPGEAYWPSYSSDPAYIRAINTGAVADAGRLGPRPAGDAATANRAFANRGAATVMSQHGFASAQRVASNDLRVSPQAAQHARVTAQAPPTSAHVGGSARLAGPGRMQALAGAVARGAAAHGVRGGATARLGGRGATSHFTGHVATRHAGGRVAAAHFHGGRAAHFAARRFGGGGHGGGPHFGGGFGGGGPHFGGGGGHGGGGPHFGGGGGHGGGGPHGGGGGHGGKGHG